MLRSLATSGSVTSILSCVAVVKRLKLLVQQHRRCSGTAPVWHCLVEIGCIAAMSSVLFVRGPNVIRRVSLGRHGKATAVNTVVWGILQRRVRLQQHFSILRNLYPEDLVVDGKIILKWVFQK